MATSEKTKAKTTKKKVVKPANTAATKKIVTAKKSSKVVASSGKKLNKVLRPGMTVKVLAGRDRDKTGKVLAVDRKKQRVTIEGVNTFLDNRKLNQGEGQIGRVEKNLPVHISNVEIIK